MALKTTVPEMAAKAKELFGSTYVNHDQIKEIARQMNVRIPGEIWSHYKVRPGRWDLSLTPHQPPSAEGLAFPPVADPNAPPPVDPHAFTPSFVNIGRHAPAVEMTQLMYVPLADQNYVPWGNFDVIKTILEQKIFYPVYVTGLSGNGKTTSILEACAALGREVIRVNFTAETDEDDLLGGFRLENGDMVWHDGPAVVAMTRGAVLLLDEVDLASHKIMCLQPILEGKGIFLKKIGKAVNPTQGFTVIATANTKGQGSDTGKFVGTNVLNEAFLDRFSITLNQEYADTATEKKIIQKTATALGMKEPIHRKFVDALVQWAQITRKTYAEGGIDTVISTRRILDTVKAYAIFKDFTKAVTMTTERFDDDTKKAFRDLWNGLASNLNNNGKEEAPAPEAPAPKKTNTNAPNSQVPF